MARFGKPTVCLDKYFHSLCIQQQFPLICADLLRMANKLWKLPSNDYVNETANHRAANDKISQSQAVKRAATFFWELTKMYIFKVVIL